jgi:hypothetical protein
MTLTGPTEHPAAIVEGASAVLGSNEASACTTSARPLYPLRGAAPGHLTACPRKSRPPLRRFGYVAAAGRGAVACADFTRHMPRPLPAAKRSPRDGQNSGLAENAVSIHKFSRVVSAGLLR